MLEKSYDPFVPLTSSYLSSWSLCRERFHPVWRCFCLPSLASLGSVKVRHNYLLLGRSWWGFSVRSFFRLVDRSPLYLLLLAIVILISGYLSDHYQSRGIITASIATLAVVGYSVYFSNKHSTTLQNLSWFTKIDYFTAANGKFVAYGAFYLMVPGMFGIVPTLYAWLANNSEPYYRRAMSIAIGTVMANLVRILFFFFRIRSSLI